MSNIRVKSRLGLFIIGLLCLNFLVAACGKSEPEKVLVLSAVSPASADNNGASVAAPPIDTNKASSAKPPAVRPTGKVAIGSPAPDFGLTTIDGDIIQLSQYKGKALVVNFWATWCPPCKEELPLLVKTFEANKDKLAILGVDVAEDSLTVKLKVREVGITYPTLLDEDRVVTNFYRVTAYPTSIFIDADGVIRAIRTGSVTEQTLKPFLDKIL